MTSTTGLRETLETERERLRLLMVEQPISGNRETYSDGFAQGLCSAIERIDAILAAPSPNGSGEQVSRISVDALANEIRRVDGDDEASLSAGALAEALMPFLSASMAGPVPDGWRCAKCGCHSFARIDRRHEDGHFTPGEWVRCVNCKAASYWPEPPAPALPEAKPVASPAEGEAVGWQWKNKGGDRWHPMHEDATEADFQRDICDYRPVYVSPDREAATREAVIEAVANAADPFLALLDPIPIEVDHKEVAALSGKVCEKFVDDALSLTVGDFRALAASLRALAQQAKPQQAKP